MQNLVLATKPNFQNACSLNENSCISKFALFNMQAFFEVARQKCMPVLGTSMKCMDLQYKVAWFLSLLILMKHDWMQNEVGVKLCFKLPTAQEIQPGIKKNTKTQVTEVTQVTQVSQVSQALEK